MESNQKPNLLVVDDNPINIKLLSVILTQEGYQVREAPEGETALQICRESPPDLVLLDVMMPGIDGYEVCQQLHQNPPTAQLPVIFITALNDVFDKVKGFDVGAVDYISKPFKKREVLARIKNHLDLSFLRRELEEKNQLLEKALDEVQQTQTQLIQSERMSALGQLVGGIAHEINNPVNFILGNINYTDQSIQDLFEVLNAYQEEYSHPSSSLQTLIDDVDVAFLQEDLPKSTGALKRGATRIQQIVQSLRNFTHLDEAGIKPTNLTKEINATLTILEPRLSPKKNRPQVEIIKDYQPLPMITCYPGDLNQALMHILNNAIDAIDQKADLGEFRQPQISIQTEVTPERRIQIKIRDNGKGVPEQARSRLFDPFFTTKPIGQAKGLGLAIAHQIITQKHHGNLTYTSTLGEGTEFILELPTDELQPE